MTIINGIAVYLVLAATSLLLFSHARQGDIIMALRQDIQDLINQFDGLLPTEATEKAAEIKAAVDAALAGQADTINSLNEQVSTLTTKLTEASSNLEAQRLDNAELAQALKAEHDKLAAAFAPPAGNTTGAAADPATSSTASATGTDGSAAAAGTDSSGSQA